MQVAVAGMTEVPDPDAVLVSQGTDVNQKCRDLIHRHNYVHLIDELGVGFNGGKETGTGRPGGLLVGRSGDNQHVERVCLFGNLPEFDHLLVKLILVGTDKCNQNGCADILIPHTLGENGVAGEGGGRSHDICVHELNGLGIQVCQLDFRHKVDAGFHIPEGYQARDVTDGFGDELHGHLRDNAERALGADHQVQQAVAGTGLAYGFAQLNNPAVRQHHGQRQHVVARDAVFDRAHATGVG